MWSMRGGGKGGRGVFLRKRYGRKSMERKRRLQEVYLNAPEKRGKAQFE